ncbi:MAG: CAP domain-containing protein [Bacteroidetes bacterium]|nr:CAP domain-containing protein [Bacteroidota bacterium]
MKLLRILVYLLCSAPLGSPGQGYVNTDSVETAVWKRINEVRSYTGLPALERHPLLDEMARNHSENMKTHKFLGHVDHNGEDPQQRKDFDFPELIGHVAEQVGFVYGKTTDELADNAMNYWLAKKKRRRITLDPAFNYIGVGAVQDLDGVYVTVDYGSLYAELITERPPDTVSAGEKLVLIYRYLGQAPRNEVEAFFLYPYPNAAKRDAYVGVEALTPEWFDGYFRITLHCAQGPGLYSFLLGPSEGMAPGGVVVEVVK